MAVRSVAKGVMKDHLIVVANNMTCTGDLNGFNTAGYKAMFRSLKIQVPFTEATLYVSNIPFFCDFNFFRPIYILTQWKPMLSNC
jgi:hypothetical protein